jgi:hypothetical protein
MTLVEQAIGTVNSGKGLNAEQAAALADAYWGAAAAHGFISDELKPLRQRLDEYAGKLKKRKSWPVNLRELGNELRAVLRGES